MSVRHAAASLLLCASAVAAQSAPLASTSLASTPPAATPAAAPVAETLWVAPRQTLPLLSLPQLGAPTAGTLATGDALAVIGRQGEFVQVRTAAGAIGWVRAANLTAAAPTTQSDLANDKARLEQQVTALDAQVRAFQDENAQLRQRLDATEAELAQHTRAVPLTPAGILGVLKRLAVEPSTWIGIAALLAALLVAFRAGVAHRNDKIRQRLGGLDL